MDADDRVIYNTFSIHLIQHLSEHQFIPSSEGRMLNNQIQTADLQWAVGISITKSDC